MDIVSRETISKYVDLVLRWNKVHNLISRKDEDNIWDRHVLNSIIIEKYIKDGSMVVDIGSGGGFPGVLLAIVKKSLNLYLVEANQKKATFLNEVRRQLSLNYQVVNDRIENLSLTGVDYVVARGFSSIVNILDLSQNIVSRETEFVLLKGSAVYNEVVEARKKFDFDHEIHEDGDTNIIVIKNVLKAPK